MELKYRFATAEDCPRLLTLIQELAHYEKAADEVTVNLEVFTDSGFGKNSVWKAIVAEDNIFGIIGFALFYTRYSTWKGPRLYLEDFIVTEEYRGRGIGKILFEMVMKESLNGPYEGMVWQVLDWNEPALNFYQKYQANLENGWLNGSLSRAQIKNIL
ncbi:MAG: GNAT family N-acetyltransferase [Pedobacter sp.]|nr:MAG: GNAT family N-acetyltransferase [Pedobacter sp.]